MVRMLLLYTATYSISVGEMNLTPYYTAPKCMAILTSVSAASSAAVAAVTVQTRMTAAGQGYIF